MKVNRKEKELKPVFGMIIAGINIASKCLGLTTLEILEGLSYYYTNKIRL